MIKDNRFYSYEGPRDFQGFTNFALHGGYAQASEQGLLMKRGSSKEDEVEEELSFYERMGKKFQKNMIIKAMSNVIGHYVLEHFGVEVPQWLQITIMIVFMTCPIWILILMVLCGEFD